MEHQGGPARASAIFIIGELHCVLSSVGRGEAVEVQVAVRAERASRWSCPS